MLLASTYSSNFQFHRIILNTSLQPSLGPALAGPEYLEGGGDYSSRKGMGPALKGLIVQWLRDETRQNEAGALGRYIQHLRKKKNQSKLFYNVYFVQGTILAFYIL